MSEKDNTIFKELLNLYFNRKILAIFLLGYSSGFPHVLVFGTMTYWMREVGLDLSTIGLFTLASTPFTLKFLWSPIIDGIKLPFICNSMGRRRGWIITLQIALISLIVMVGHLDPAQDLSLMALFAVIISFCAASQDIVIDAVRVEMLSRREQGAGATAGVQGYRIAAIVAGGLIMIIASYTGWAAAFTIAAATMLLGVIGCLIALEPKNHNNLYKFNWENIKLWFSNFVVGPFSDFTKNHRWYLIIAFIILYKLGDAYLGAMANPFYFDMGFSKEEIGLIAKTYGTITSIIGAFIGGWIVYKIGIYKSLLWLGLFQALTNLTFAWLANVGHDTTVLTVVITLENASGAMGTTAFVAYLSSLCNLKFTATQYALLTSVSAVSRTWLSSVSGYIVDAEEGFGVPWDSFFIITMFMAIPALILIRFIRPSSNNA